MSHATLAVVVEKTRIGAFSFLFTRKRSRSSCLIFDRDVLKCALWARAIHIALQKLFESLQSVTVSFSALLLFFEAQILEAKRIHCYFVQLNIISIKYSA